MFLLVHAVRSIEHLSVTGVTCVTIHLWWMLLPLLPCRLHHRVTVVGSFFRFAGVSPFHSLTHGGSRQTFGFHYCFLFLGALSRSPATCIKIDLFNKFRRN